MKLTLKQLRSAGKEINKLFGNEAIDIELDEAGITKLLYEALELIDMESDKFTDATTTVLEELIDAQKKLAPKKVKGVKAPVAKEEEEEEEEEEETEEEEEKEEEEEAPATLEEQIKAATKLSALHALVEGNKEFKKLSKVVDKFKNVATLKQAMLDVLIENAPAKSTKATKEEKPAKAEKAPKAPKAEGEKKKGSPFQKIPGVLSFQETADKLLAEEADEATILKTFTDLYKERKGVEDADFVKGRAAIYMNIAKKSVATKK